MNESSYTPGSVRILEPSKILERDNNGTVIPNKDTDPTGYENYLAKVRANFKEGDKDVLINQLVDRQVQAPRNVEYMLDLLEINDDIENGKNSKEADEFVKKYLEKVTGFSDKEVADSTISATPIELGNQKLRRIIKNYYKRTDLSENQLKIVGELLKDPSQEMMIEQIRKGFGDHGREIKIIELENQNPNTFMLEWYLKLIDPSPDEFPIMFEAFSKILSKKDIQEIGPLDKLDFKAREIVAKMKSDQKYMNNTQLVRKIEKMLDNPKTNRVDSINTFIDPMAEIRNQAERGVPVERTLSESLNKRVRDISKKLESAESLIKSL